MKKFRSLLSILLLLVLGVVLVGCNANTSEDTSQIENAYITLDINPSIEIITDDQGLVSQVNGLNEDAQVLLIDTNFVGKTVDETIDAIINLAINMGYIGYEEANAIIVTAVAENVEETDQLETDIEEHLHKHARDHEYQMEVIRAAHEATQEEIDKALELGITVGKLRLINIAMTIDETLTYEVAKDMSVRNLNKIIKDSREEMRDFISDELRKEFEDLKLSLRLDYFVNRVQNIYDALVLSDEARLVEVIKDSTATKEELTSLYKQYLDELVALKNQEPVIETEPVPNDNTLALQELQTQIDAKREEIAAIVLQFKGLEETDENYETLKATIKTKISELNELEQQRRQLMLESIPSFEYNHHGFNFGYQDGSFHFSWERPENTYQSIRQKYVQEFNNLNVSLDDLEAVFEEELKAVFEEKINEIQTQLEEARAALSEKINECKDEFRQRSELRRDIWENN